MRFRLSKPTPAFVVATAALLVSLGGTSYAVTQIGSAGIRDNSVRSVDIANGTIRTVDIKDGAVRTSDVADGSLLRKDFADGVLLRGTQGPKGDQGAQGAQGPQGAPGAQGVATRWALIDETGAIVAASDDGFTVLDAYVTNANVYIDAGEDLTDNGVVASIATQNLVDRDGLDGDAEPNFAGEISGSRCQIDGAVNCAPASAKNVNSFVVTPRDSAGASTTATNRIRFYVVLTGDSSDYVPAP